eukprot:TRINITY_DN11179_c1_g2_i1.p1 TRINITY_DN11179_c1_g2~~TRINITY_DN11179_c1_g2_i1.p1  ORF type:complete len:1629 (+),score=648.50 TRINITY_DN11179_c1_g2_i1:36-4889(+)
MGAQQGTPAGAAAMSSGSFAARTPPQSTPPRAVASPAAARPPSSTPVRAREASSRAPDTPAALRTGADERVLVAVRVRPLTSQEKAAGERWMCTSVTGSNRLTLQRDERGSGARSFVFDRLWWSVPGASDFKSQRDVYEDMGKLMLDHAFAGYNTCIFAYGQTSSGKTYTMMGDSQGGDDTRGIIPRACQDIFNRIGDTARPSARSTGSDERIQSYEVVGSYYEIYNEKVYDLLDNDKTADGLRVREHPLTGPYVEGLRTVTVALHDEVVLLMQQGNRRRHTNQTRLNDHSSRSHAIFTLTLKQTLYRDGELIEYLSKINLVDLAGSERTKMAGTSGDAFIEGVNINKSLANLGQVIHNLAERDQAGRSGYINFRDSQLTWLLRENLGGNSKTIMVATVSPAPRCYDETLNTLRYADRVKLIKQKATVNEDSTTKLIRDLRHEVAALRKQNMELSRLRHELSLTRSSLREAEDRIEQVRAQTGGSADLSMLPDDSPYLTLLRPNPQPAKPFILRLQRAATLLTDAADAGPLPADVPADATRIALPELPRRACVIRRVGDIAGGNAASRYGAGAGVFGTRLCELVPLQTPCSVVLPYQRAQSPQKGAAVALSHGCIVTIGAMLLRFSDPWALEAEADPIQEAADAAAREGSDWARTPVSSPRPTAALVSRIVSPQSVSIPTPRRPSPGTGSNEHQHPPARSPPASDPHRQAQATPRSGQPGLTATSVGGSRAQQTPQLPSMSEGTPRTPPAHSPKHLFQQASELINTLAAGGSVNPEQVAQLQQLLSGAVSQRQASDTETEGLRQQVADLEGAADALKAEKLQEGELLRLKVMEATKEAEGKDVVIEDLRAEMHKQREMAEGMMQQLSEDAERAREEAVREHAERCAKAEEEMRRLNIEAEQKDVIYNRDADEMRRDQSESLARCSALNTVLHETEAALQQERARCEQTTHTLGSVQEAYNTLIGDVEDMRGKLDSAMRQKEMSDQEKRDLEERIRQVEERHKEKLSRICQEHQMALARLQERDEELAKARSRETALADRLDTAQRDAAERLRQKQLELEHLHKLTTEKEFVAATAEAQCRDLRSRVDGTEEELRGLQAELSQRHEEIRRKEQDIVSIRWEKESLHEAYQREARSSEEQLRAREKAFSDHAKHIGELHKEIGLLQQKAAVAQDRNRDLFQRENQIRERKQRLVVELDIKEKELKETRVKYSECYARLQATIRKGQRESQQADRMRRLTQVVKEGEARIQFLEKELQDSQALTRRLEETRSVQHSQEQVQNAKEDMLDVMTRLKAEVIEFSPPALRQVQTIVNSVQHAADPRRIFRQAFNHLRLVVKELSGRDQDVHGGAWSIEESHLGAIKPFQKSAVLKAMREIVIWHGISPDFTRQHFSAYAELVANARWLLLLARICQNPNAFGDVGASRSASQDLSLDASLRGLVAAGRRAAPAGICRPETAVSPKAPEPPAVHRAQSQRLPTTSPQRIDFARVGLSMTAKPADLFGQRDPSLQQRSTSARVPRTSITTATTSGGVLARSRSPTVAASVAMRSVTQPNDLHPEEDDESRRRPEGDPSKKAFMQPTLSSQSKENQDRHRYPLAAHMAQSRKARGGMRLGYPSRGY